MAVSRHGTEAPRTREQTDDHRAEPPRRAMGRGVSGAISAGEMFIAGKDHFSTGNRQKAMSRIATGNYDAVIVSHRSFEKLPVSDEYFSRFVGSRWQNSKGNRSHESRERRQPANRQGTGKGEEATQ